MSSADKASQASPSQRASEAKSTPWRVPLIVYLACAVVYVGTAGPRLMGPTPDNHFVHLALSFLHGQLGVLGNHPAGTNDWACYDDVAHDICDSGAWPPPWGRGPNEHEHWYISFPPVPALVILPAAAIWGTDTRDALFWSLFAALSPTFVFILLRSLRERGHSTRTQTDDLLLTFLYAFGTVFFFVAVNGSVWFAGHVVGSVLLPLFLLFSLDSRSPLLAGLLMGLLFLTRPSSLYLTVIPLVEMLRMSRAPDAIETLEERSAFARLGGWLRSVVFRDALKRVALFALPILVIGGLAMAMNAARFERPTEFGHRFLMIGWRGRIETWGLFNYHYLPKNLAIFTSSLPWLTANDPHVLISRHGLALWFTTPALLLVFFPKTRLTATMRALMFGAAFVCVMDLAYQNSGWVQFGYRFACDYMVVLIALIAMGGRKLRGPGFITALLFAIAVNTFGAITFDRLYQFYDDDHTQERVFQPD